jgi:hypothetical protein
MGSDHYGLATKRDKRVRWDLNPRSPAPKADTLIRARLRTLFYAQPLVHGAKGDKAEVFSFCMFINLSLISCTMKHLLRRFQQGRSLF